MPHRGKQLRDQLAEPVKRAAIARLALMIMVDSRGLTGIDGVVDRLIYHAVMDATVNGVLTNAFKIADRTKVPYTTVKRHIDHMKEIGVLLAFSKGWVGVNPDYANSAGVLNRMAEIWQEFESLLDCVL